MNLTALLQAALPAPGSDVIAGAAGISLSLCLTAVACLVMVATFHPDVAVRNRALKTLAALRGAA